MPISSWSLTPSDNATADASINWQEGQSPSSINNSARAMMAAIKAGFNDVAGVSVLGGSGDTFALSLSQPMASLGNAVVGFFATRANTGAVTLNVDGLGAKPLRLTSGVALSAGQIVNGAFYQCAYNPATSEWLIVGRYLITNADHAQMAANTIKGNLTGTAATPSDIALADLKTAIVPDDSVTNAKLAEVGANTVKANITGATANPSDVSLSDLAAALIATGAFVGVPSGAVSAFAMSSAPSGWLACNGSAVSRTTYATLFAAIGTTYGAGDGSTTFALPDLRGEFVRGYDGGRGVDSGRVFGSAQDDAMQGHKHSITPAPQVGSGLGYSGTSGVNGSSTTQTGTPVTDGTNGTPRTAAETRPRNVALLYCIKT